MQAFTTTELTRMRSAQEASMMDTCVVLTYTVGAADDYGMPTQPWPEGDTLSCGFDPGGAREVMGGTQVVERPATLRLPVGTDIDTRDRVQITHRHGEELGTAPVYAFIGDAERGPSGLVFRLRLVADTEVKDQ